MKILAFALVLAAGCGSEKKVELVDAFPDGNQLACDPINQTGCNPNEKCTWIIDQLSPEFGHIGCAPLSGNEVAIGSPCLDASDPGGPPAGPNGFDNCAAGAVCVARICKGICDPQMAGAASKCDSSHTCGRYTGLLEVAGTIVAGACDSNCNILDQTQFDGAEACGSSDPTDPNQGCYINPFFKKAADGTTGSCAPVRNNLSPPPTNPQDQQNLDGIKHNDRIDRVKPLINPTSGSTFKNSCAPGYLPLYFESETSMKALCTGICAPPPAGVNSTTVAANSNAEFGDETIPVKLPRKPTAVAGDGLCLPGKRGNNTAELENCVFAWGLFLQTDGTVNPELGPEGEQFGFCFPYSTFTYDSDGDGADDTGFPNLATLPPRSNQTPGTFPANADDACDFVVTRNAACTRAEAMLFQSQPMVPQKQMFRLGDLDAPALRR